MTGMPANNYNQATFDAIEKYQVGSIILTGRSNLSVPEMKDITDKLQGLAPANRKLLISCDQEEEMFKFSKVRVFHRFLMD